MNWFLDKGSQTPQKALEESAALLNVDFPDDESDQEYDPLKDPEAMVRSFPVILQILFGLVIRENTFDSTFRGFILHMLSHCF